MRTKVIWTLAGAACVIVVAGVALLWRWQGTGLGISVGLPVAATLIAPIVSWAFSAPLHSGQSTAEQLQAAAQVMVDRELDRWRKAAITEPALTRGPNTLNVPWVESEVSRHADVASEDTRTIVELADELRAKPPRRLIVVGRVGSGKTALARMLIGELLKDAEPSAPVPVFLPLSAWNPDLESLYDWMERRIGDENPKLRDKSCYGPTAIPSLAERRILPVLDGLDVLPKEVRRSVITSGDLLLQNRFILTCRDEEFIDALDGTRTLPNTSTVRPWHVCRKEMIRFLQQVTDEPRRWDEVFNQLEQVPRLAQALSDPRIIYLASVVYQDASDKIPFSKLIDVAKQSYSIGDVETYLLNQLLPALMHSNDKQARGYPWYNDRWNRWLAFLTDSTNGIIGRDFDDIAWWRFYRAVPRLSRLQVPLRALFTSVAVWLVVASLLHGRYGQLTGLAYASAIAAACLFLAPHRTQNELRPFSRPAWRWWMSQMLSRSWRFMAAGATAFLGFGFFIGLRIALTGHLDTGIRTGAADGAVAGMVVVLGAVIAGIPTSPRADSRVEAESTVRPNAAPIAVALTLGVFFGLLSGILTVIKHQHATSPSLKQGLIYGLIMGLDFAMGTWLVRRTVAHFGSGNASDPLTGLRAERAVALLVPAILGLTFASAFGLNAQLHWDPVSGIANGMVGIIVGSLASDWPIYIGTVAFLAFTGQLPIRIMKFLEFWRSQGIFRPVLQTYQFREDPNHIGLSHERSTLRLQSFLRRCRILVSGRLPNGRRRRKRASARSAD